MVHVLTDSLQLHHLPECLVLDPVMCKMQGVRDSAHVERVGQLVQVPCQVIGRQVHTCDRLDLGFLQPVRIGHSVDSWLEKTILSVKCLCCIGYYMFIETALLELFPIFVMLFCWFRKQRRWDTPGEKWRRWPASKQA